MRSASLLFVLGLLACPSMAALAKTQGPSSQIPDRREFPVNDQINPCQDFYQYACSKVIKNFKLRDDRSDHTFAFDDSAERLLEKKKTFLRKIAHTPAKSSSLSPRTQTLATIYNSCMDSDARRLEEKQRVSQTLSKLASIKDKAEFSQFLADERQAARTSLYEIGNIADQDQPASYNFYFSVNAMSLPERSYYENAEVQRDFKKVLSSFYQTLGQKNATATAQTVLDFESAFAKVYPKPAEWREIMVEKREISRDDLIQRYPSFRMAETLKQVPQTTKIRHLIPESFAFLQDHLTHDSLDTLKAVYLFQSLAPLLDDAYPAFEKSYRAFRIKHLGESKLRPDRQERCTMLVMDKFTKELDAELLPEIFPSFPEEKFIALAEDIRKSIINGIQSNQWLSPEGKAGASLKMSKATLQLVKPRSEEEWHFNPSASYDLKTPLANMDNLRAKLQERTFAELSQARNPKVWEMGPLTVNAYYSAEDNKFVMPIGILQYPFYDPTLPLFVNLGAVGAVIGHELGHGIDDKGALFDAEGRLKQWMSAQDLKNFQERGQSFVKQFDKIGHNGQLTLGENIGDLTGVTFAYRAAFPDGKGSNEDKKAFFLQFARVWCGVILPKFEEQRLKTDPHSAGWARVNQQLRNQADFARAYECKAQDAMVLPESETVKIW